MFVLSLRLTDSDDAGYFTNKALNKLHGYIRHKAVKLAIFFTLKSIEIYAGEKKELEELCENEAINFDIKRHIFDAEINKVNDSHINVFQRVRDTIYNLEKTVNEKSSYYKKHFSLNKIEKEEKRKKTSIYYEEKQQRQKNRRYFIIKNKEKCFTVWLEVRKIKVVDFPQTVFNSYGLLSTSSVKEDGNND